MPTDRLPDFTIKTLVHPQLRQALPRVDDFMFRIDKYWAIKWARQEWQEMESRTNLEIQDWWKIFTTNNLFPENTQITTQLHNCYFTTCPSVIEQH